jgi:hypothetical protein
LATKNLFKGAGVSGYPGSSQMSRLRDLSARLVFDCFFVPERAYCIDEVAAILGGQNESEKAGERIERAIAIGLEMGLLAEVNVSDGSRYFAKLRPDWRSKCPSSSSSLSSGAGASASASALLVNAAIFEADKLVKETASLVRQARIVQAAKASGDDDRVEELIRKWRTAGREALDQLYVLKAANCGHEEESSMGSKNRFIRALGLLPADFYSDPEDEELEESEMETETETASYSDSENFHGHNNGESKRIKRAEGTDDD